MKFLFLSTSFLFLSLSIFSQDKKTNCEKINTLIQVINKTHYKPIKLDEEHIFFIKNDLIKQLDARRLIFSQEDRNFILNTKYSIDNFTTFTSCEFIAPLINLYQTRLEESKKIIENILANKLPYTSNLNITFNPVDKTTTESLHTRWTKWLTYNALLEQYQSDSVDISKTINAKLLKQENYKIDKILHTSEGLHEYILDIFLNSISKAYDPHTNYFSVHAKASFEASLSKVALSYGLDFQENTDGDIEITELTPGGPAWKSNKLNDGDIVSKIFLSNNQSIELAYIDPDEITEIINRELSDSIGLEVKKKNGKRIKLFLYKAPIENQDNIFTSFVLKGNKNIGYIALPAFYTSQGTGNTRGLGCANDIAKEIVKLKKENIHGLILDLRNNGGGSMLEAMDLAGIFINYGPLFIYDEKGDKPRLVKDLNRGTIFNKPLVILINGLSASASEIVAGTLKDYNRAIIVGNPSYGKSTAQNIFPLDKSISLEMTNFDHLDNTLGYVKVTMGMMYRLDGNSHQLKGVQPNINLPDLYSFYEYKESTYPTALKSTKIEKDIYFTLPPKLPIKELTQKSKERVIADTGFYNITTAVNLLKKYYLEERKVKLSKEGISNDLNTQLKAIALLEKALSQNTSSLKVVFNRYDKELLTMDKFRKNMLDSQIDEIKNDIYIEESYNILIDLIDINNQ